jgi:cell pole-organizing protein PopZ
MSNQGPAQEPTMEEILASIRRIISEDTETKEEGAGEEMPPPPALAESETLEFEPEEEPEEFLAESGEAQEPGEPAGFDEDIVFDEEGEEEVLELVEPLPEEIEDEYVPESGPVAQASAPEPEFEAGFEAEFEIEPASEPDIDFEEPAMTAQPTPGSGLLSSEAANAASAAFGALASTLLTSSGSARTLEDLVSDMLRPMLKQWLDQNLPPLVERLVREEIERVSRRR